jgi:multisubunit Na+/H+ antiporter MnhC subunit
MHNREREIVGLTALARRVTPIAQEELGGDHGPMLRNPIIVCLTLAAIVVLAAIAEAAVVLTSRRRRRIAW